MAEPFTTDELDRLRQLHAEGKSVRAIANDLGRSFSTVSRHARHMGLKFDTERTQAATEKRSTENRLKRAELESRFLDEAAALLDQLHEPHLVYSFGGRDNTYAQETLPQPDVGAKRALIQAAGTAVDKAIKLADVDKTTTGADAGKSMIGSLFAALAVTPVADDPEPDPEPEQ